MNERRIARRIESLPELVALADAALKGAPMQAAQRHALDFALEELFTNMVKYAPGGAPTIAVRIARLPEGAEVTLLDADVDGFDVTRAPPVDVTRALAEREPGGLGLHLLRRLVDELDYRYDPQRRAGLTRFRVAFVKREEGGPC